MIRIFNVFDPICATCEYWEEKNKQIGFQNRQFYMEYGHPQGYCLCENHTLRNGSSRICEKFKRWHKLPEKK